MMNSGDGEGEVWSWEPEIIEPSAPFFFRTVTGAPISFLVIDDHLSKQRLEKLILTYGGSICCDLVEPSTVIIVNKGFTPPQDWGPCYYRDFIRHCIEIYQIVELSEYLAQGIHGYTERYLSSCLYYEKLKFRQSPLPVTHFSVDSDSKPTSANSPKSLHRFIGQPKELKIKFGSGSQQLFVGSYCGCYKEFKVLKELPVSSYNDGESICTVPVGSKRKFSALELRLNVVRAGEIKNQEMGVSFMDLSKKDGVLQSSDLTLCQSAEQVPDSSIEQVGTDSPNEITPDSNSSPLDCQTMPSSPGLENSTPVGMPVAVESSLNQSSDSDSDMSIDLSNWPKITQHLKTNKHTRSAYSNEEKNAIIKYIVSKKAYNRLKSDALYREMEGQNICPKRTYQSIKNHFLKTLIYELDTFPFLTEREKTILLEKTLTPSLPNKMNN